MTDPKHEEREYWYSFQLSVTLLTVRSNTCLLGIMDSLPLMNCLFTVLLSPQEYLIMDYASNMTQLVASFQAYNNTMNHTPLSGANKQALTTSQQLGNDSAKSLPLFPIHVSTNKPTTTENSSPNKTKKIKIK